MKPGRIRPSQSFARLAALPLLTACSALAISAVAQAQGTHLWKQSQYAQLEHGTPKGIAIASDGRLIPGPQATRVLTTPSTYVWSIASDRAGNVYLGTGTPASVLKVTPDGKSTTLFTSHDMSVQAVGVGPHGSVYAATLPSGKVYKLDPGAAGKTGKTATVVFDPSATSLKPKYVWALAFDAQGRLYVATGAPAAIYRVAPGGKPTLFFRSDEEHIRTIAFEKNGDLIAGTDGSGLIYRINPAGKGYILYDSPKKEITSVAIAPNGSIYAAGTGKKGKNSLPPLPVSGQSSVTATITIIAPGSVQAFNHSTLIPNGSQVYEIPNGDGAPRTIWTDQNDIVYSLKWTPQGLLAATGNRGIVYRILDDGSYADIAHLQAAQITGFADTAKGLYVGTANSGKLYRLSHGPAPEGTYRSKVFDAGLFSQWGRSEVETASGSAGIKMYARAGNIQNPLRSWSQWKQFTPNVGPIGIPPSRFMQWKLVEQPGSAVESVGINYLPVNMPPVIGAIVVAPGTRVPSSQQQQPDQPQQVAITFDTPDSDSSDAQPSQGSDPLPAITDRNFTTVRWMAHDPNGDHLIFSVYYRAKGEQNWQLLKKRVHAHFYSFDSAQLPDGRYRIRVVASDAPSHNPGQGLTTDRISNQFLVDTAPPVVSSMKASLSGASIHASFTATDPLSVITHAEFSIDAGRWHYLSPVGNIADSLTEHFALTAPLPHARHGVQAAANPGEHVIAFRIYDRNHNAVTTRAVVR